MEPGDSQIPDFLTLYRKTNRRGWSYPVENIEYNEDLGYFLWSKIKSMVYREQYELLAFNELEQVKEPHRSALHSFLVNIWAYGKNVPESRRDTPLVEIIEKSLKIGPKYAKYIDGLKSWLMTKKFNRQNLSSELKETYETSYPNEAKFTCIGDIFRSNQLFPWIPPNPDIVAITGEEVEVEPWAGQMFRAELRAYLHSKEEFLFFKPNNDERTLLVDNTKAAYEGPQWKLGPVRAANVRGPSRVAWIPRELRESRAAVVEEQSSSLRIRWIDSEVRRLLRADKRCAMETRSNVLHKQLIDAIKEYERFNHKLKRKEKSERWSYCRDFKKEGLTKNRVLCRIMLEELRDRFPTAQAFQTVRFFDDWEFELDGVTYKTKRGHGLGMANALTTLMQIVIERMTVSRMVDIKIVKSFYNNDDAALIFESEQCTRRYCDIDRNTCEALGLAYKTKSTFIAHQHLVFCEQYVSPDAFTNDKSTFAYASLALLMKAINASHAREMSLSMNIRNVRSTFAQTVCDYWGPVLFSNEFTRPRCLGGWFRLIEQGVDTSFKNINANMVVPQMEESANYAYLETKLEYTPWKKKFFVPEKTRSIAKETRDHEVLALSGKKLKEEFVPRGVYKIPTKRSLVYDQEWLVDRDEKLFLGRNDIFRAERNIQENVRAWIAFEKKLKSNFSKACSWWSKRRTKRRTFGDVYRSECDKRPKEDILPPIYERIEISSFEASYTDDMEFEHPYRTPDAQQDLRLFKAGIALESYPRKMGMTDRIHLGAKDFPKGKKGGAQRAISLRHLYGTGKVPLKIWNLFLVPSEKTFPYWHNPFAIGAISDALGRNYNSYIPKYISDEKKELIAARDRWYGRALTWKEWMVIGSNHPSDILLLYLIRESWNAKPVWGENHQLEAVSRVLKRFPGCGQFIEQSKTFRFDDVTDLLEKWIEVGLRREYRQKEKNDKRLWKEAERRENALFQEFDHEINPVAEQIFVTEHYQQRNDPPDIFKEEGVEEEVLQGAEEFLDEIFFEEDEYIPFEDEVTVEDQLSDIFL